MAKKTRVILVDEHGNVEPQVVVYSAKIERVKWLPAIEGEKITITFPNTSDVPFSDKGWNDRTSTGNIVKGKLNSKGPNTYRYVVKGWGTKKASRANPELIVDGGMVRTPGSRATRTNTSSKKR
jgi:hypothetical protein